MELRGRREPTVLVGDRAKAAAALSESRPGRHDVPWGDGNVMASTIKAEDLETYRRILERLQSRLKGDLSQMTDEALKRNQPESSGSQSNMPVHMADLGTENYDQEFTLSLIENEQATLDQIREALWRIEHGGFGACDECGRAITRARLQALPYTKHCIECARRLENG